jgi:hypothetical protein
MGCVLSTYSRSTEPCDGFVLDRPERTGIPLIRA